MIPHVKPDWLQAALKSPNKTAVELPGIVRSPVLDGYRSVADTTGGTRAHKIAPNTSNQRQSDQ